VASSNPSARRNIISAVLTVLEAYKSAFRVQISNALAHSAQQQQHQEEQMYTGPNSNSGGTRTVDDLLDEVFVDSLGFLGLYPLFLSVASLQPKLPLDGVFGLKWGDHDGRIMSLRRRHLMSVSDALHQFLHLHSSRKVHEKGTSSASDTERLSKSSKAILSVFSADEDRFLTYHPTEFWF